MFLSKIASNLTSTNDIKVNTLLQLSEFTLQNNWSPFTFKDGYRHESSWASCDLMALDIDNDGQYTCTIEQAKELFKDYTYLIVTTKSHQILKNGKTVDRFRVILPLSSTIRDKEIYKNTWYSLSNKFPFIDQQCKDLARFYFSSKSYVCQNNAKPIDPVVQEIIPLNLNKPELKLMVTKGKFSRATSEFIINGVQAGGRNISAFRAGKDLQEQGYTEEEAFERMSKSPSVDDDFTLNELEKAIRSAYSNDPKYDPRGISEKKDYVAQSASDLEQDPDLFKRKEEIRGPSFWDCTQEKWRKGEVLGLVAASGTGKSAVSMKIVRDIINNNKDNDDIHFFFSLEMPARQILQRWTKLVGKDSPHSKRLYVIDNKTGDERITWQHIVKYVQDTCKHLNKKPGVVIVDHFMALSDKIDITKEPNFDISTDVNSGRGKVKTIPIKEMCRLMKVVAEMLGCFLVVQNQSTIERAGHGDTPMGINAAYGAAQFSWFSDYIITVWQPLKRVQSETSLTCSGWQYSKIREINPGDLTRTYTQHNLYYDLVNGDFRLLSDIEEQEFNLLIQKADQLRKSADKKESTAYKRSPSGFQHFAKLTSIDGGKKDE